MHIGWKIAGTAGLIGIGALALAACGGPKEQDAESKLLEDFQKFDRNPRDNNWAQNETTLFEVGRPYSTNRHHTYRVPDLFSDGYTQFYEQQIVHRETTSDMSRLFAAARGNDAIASLAELKQVALRFDKDGNGTLNRSERSDFDDQFEAQERSRTILDRVEVGSYYVRNDYPDPGYPGTPGNGGTSGGDDSGFPGTPGNGGTSGGDEPGFPGSGNGGTSGGDEGGSYTPPPSNGGGTSGGDSTDNGNPNEGDF